MNKPSQEIREIMQALASTTEDIEEIPPKFLGTVVQAIIIYLDRHYED